MIDRRAFLKGSAAVAAGAVVGGGGLGGCAPAGMPEPVTPLGLAGEAGIDHIVVVMMENRSMDHLLGWLPGTDPAPSSWTFADRAGVTHRRYHLTQPAACGLQDPNHSYSGGRVELNGGSCDGFLKTTDDLLPIGYYDAADLPFLGTAAPAWTTCDRYFAATMGPTFPNRLYQHAGQSDRMTNTLAIAQMPSIWDRLKAKGIECRYYCCDVPIIALWGLSHADITRPFDGFLADCKAGRLPYVSYLDPKFLIDGVIGTSADYHPLSDVRPAERFLHQVYEAVVTSPNWERTVLVINFDEWGGFADHIAPEVAPDVHPSLGLRGFRVPCVVVSPLARRNFVTHDTYDHTSVLRMIEWGFGLDPLTVRDENANNLADVLDLSRPPDLDAPRWPFPDITTQDCLAELQDELMGDLGKLARSMGFN